MFPNQFLCAIASSVIFACLPFESARSEQHSLPETKELIVGHWIGEGDNIVDPYTFHTVNCSNGRFGTIFMQEGKDHLVYIGNWETDGTTITHHGEVVATFDRQTFDLLSTTEDRFSNTYHIVLLTENLFVYEWRGQITRRFLARRAENDGQFVRDEISRDWFVYIACYSGDQTS